MSTALGKVRGTGSAKNGTHHWWMHRLTALALVPLTVWFLVSLVALVGASHAEVVAWISNPFSTTLLLLFVGVTFYHLLLGLQVVIEDYIHGGMKIAAMIAVSFGCWVVGLAAVVAVLKIAFGA